MTNANKYVLKNWNKYGDFKSDHECKLFLICCEAYNTSYEIAHEAPETCYSALGFVWLYSECCTTRHCIEAITEYAALYENTTRDDVALKLAIERYEDNKQYYIEMGETVESIKNDILSGVTDDDVIQIDNDVIWRVYC